MTQIKPTRVDYVIAAFGIIPIAAMTIWRTEIAAWTNIAPKFVAAAGIALSVLAVVGLTLLVKRGQVRYRVHPINRIYGLALLACGATYFFVREEIAEAIGWPTRVGDGLMIFASVIASLWLLGKIEPAQESDETP